MTEFQALLVWIHQGARGKCSYFPGRTPGVWHSLHTAVGWICWMWCPVTLGGSPTLRHKGTRLKNQYKQKWLKRRKASRRLCFCLELQLDRKHGQSSKHCWYQSGNPFKTDPYRKQLRCWTLLWWHLIGASMNNKCPKEKLCQLAESTVPLLWCMLRDTNLDKERGLCTSAHRHPKWAASPTWSGQTCRPRNSRKPSRIAGWGLGKVRQTEPKGERGVMYN